MDIATGLGWPRSPAHPDAMIATVADMNPFPVDPSCGVGRGAALANLLQKFRGPGTPLRPPLSTNVPPMAPCPAPTTVSVPRPWLHIPPQLAPSTYDTLATPAMICPPSLPPASADAATDSPSVPAEEPTHQASWGEMMDAAEAQGEFVDNLHQPDDPGMWVGATPTNAAAPLPQSPPSPPVPSADPDDVPVSDAEEDVPVRDVGPTPAPPVPPTLVSKQKALLDLVRPLWLYGEPSVADNVRPLAQDHGLDFSPKALDTALAWMLLQRRDIVAHLRHWLSVCNTPERDPSKFWSSWTSTSCPWRRPRPVVQ